MTIAQRTEISFSIGIEQPLSLVTAPGVFTPNATTTLLIQAVRDSISAPVSLLELGCGTGVVGLALHRSGHIKTPVYASDLSEPAVLCSRENFARHGCAAEVRGGSLFEPWAGERFDVVVDDISGIAQDVAVVSPWFQGVPCNTGEDGIDLVADILCNAPTHLNTGGSLFFPVLSLSNVDKLLQTARANFATVQQVGRQDWPLPADLKAHLPLLRKLAAAGSIKLEEKFGMVLCYTEVYRATNPITQERG